MRVLPAQLTAALAEDASRFCHCWWLTRVDGMSLGLTDHDKPLTFEGKSFEPSQAIKVEKRRQFAGFDGGIAQVEGALSHDGISEADILAGRWDGASIEIWLVSWADASLRLLLDVSTLIDIRRREGLFTAELKGVMQRLDEIQGRRYLPGCDATLGDQRCKIDLNSAAFRVSATVNAVVDPRQLTVAAPGAPAQAIFEQGTIERANGDRLIIQSHVRLDGGHRLQLFEAPELPLISGEALTLVFGCDKRFRTCRNVFANAVNFRGFPHIPGSSFVLGAQKPGTGLVGPRE
jgi:uncharacterized phage protein (TIGR02218 family)